MLTGIKNTLTKILVFIVKNNKSNYYKFYISPTVLVYNLTDKIHI